MQTQTKQQGRVLHFTATDRDTQDHLAAIAPIARIDRWLASKIAELVAADEADAADNEGDPNSTSGVLAGLTRTQIKRLIVGGHLTANGSHLTDPSAQVRVGVHYSLTLPPPQPPPLRPEAIPLDIVFEDRHLLVVNKPVGMVTHPAPGNATGTLVNALLHHCGEALLGVGATGRPGIVHRLDKDTSGVMLVAKTHASQQKLGEMFAKHALTRHYIALVWRLVGEAEFTIDAAIARHPYQRKKMAVVKPSTRTAGNDEMPASTNTGKAAITHVKLMQYLPPWASLVECRLETGRTHQIRVHLAHARHSVVGDKVYGRPPRLAAQKHTTDADKASHTRLSQFPRQALHAAHIGFNHPITGEAMEFNAPLPKDMTRLLAQMTPASQ